MSNENFRSPVRHLVRGCPLRYRSGFGPHYKVPAVLVLIDHHNKNKVDQFRCLSAIRRRYVQFTPKILGLTPARRRNWSDCRLSRLLRNIPNIGPTRYHSHCREYAVRAYSCQCRVLSTPASYEPA